MTAQNWLTVFVELLYADDWSEEEYAKFKSDHVAIYSIYGVSSRPSALRQLLDNGKIDLIESRDVQKMLFDLDRAYEYAIRQSETTDRSLSHATTVIAEEIPYGTKEDIMALPDQPDILLESDRLKSAIRWFVFAILLCSLIQLCQRRQVVLRP